MFHTCSDCVKEKREKIEVKLTFNRIVTYTFNVKGQKQIARCTHCRINSAIASLSFTIMSIFTGCTPGDMYVCEREGGGVNFISSYPDVWVYNG